MPKRYRQLQEKDLPKVPTSWLEWDSNLRPHCVVQSVSLSLRSVPIRYLISPTLLRILVNKLVSWCAWLLSSALEILRLRLRLRYTSDHLIIHTHIQNLMMFFA